MSLSDSGQNMVILAGRQRTCNNFTVMLVEELVIISGEHIAGAPSIAVSWMPETSLTESVCIGIKLGASTLS